MFHAKIITGGSQEKRLTHIRNMLETSHIADVDCITLKPEPEKDHIGIDAVRGFVHHIRLSPIASVQRAGILYDGHTATIEAQNALLRILEEPPRSAIIIMETPDTTSLLPTILSRCQIITLPSDDSLNTPLTPLDLLSHTWGSLISALSTEVTDKNSAKQWISTRISNARNELLRGIDNTIDPQQIKSDISLIRALEQALQEIEGNINPKLAIEYALFSVKKSTVMGSSKQQHPQAK